MLPMIALYRNAKLRPATSLESPISGLLLAVTLPFMLAPGGQYLLPNPWLSYWLAAHEALWFLTLGFLLWLAHRGREQAPSTRGHTKWSGPV